MVEIRMALASHKRSNFLQIVGYATVTLVLAAAVAIGAIYYFLQFRQIKIAAGPRDGVYYRFAQKLARVVERDTRVARVLVVPTENDAASLAALNRGDVQMAIARTDARFPADARALAILEREPVFIVTPKARNFSAIAGLKGQRVAVPGADGRNEAVVRKLLESFGLTGDAIKLSTVPVDASFDGLLLTPPPAFQAIVAIMPSSRLGAPLQRAGLLRRAGQLELNGVDAGEALERKMPGLFAESIEAGAISTSPLWPDEALDSVALHHLLLARRQMQISLASEIARVVLDNKDELSLDQEFATNIEPPDVEKTARVPAHRGAADFVNGDVKTFLDRYGDYFYIGSAAAGVIGSLCVAIYSWITKVEPVRASSLAAPVIEIASRLKGATTLADIDLADTELQDVLKQVLAGLQDGTISSEGLDAFRLAYDEAHRALMARRHALTSGQFAVPAV
jgi:TRAP-type uncharacterized transport system substrate-binding protein